MTDLRKNTPLKVAAFTVSFLCFAVFALSAAGVAYMASEGFYTAPEDAVVQEHLERVAYDYAHMVMGYSEYEIGDDFIERRFSGYNFFLEIRDEDGKLICGNNSGEDYRFYIDSSYTYYSCTYRDEDGVENTFIWDGDEPPTDITIKSAVRTVINIRLFVRETFTFSDRLSSAEFFVNLGYKLRYPAIAAGVICLFAGIILFVYLLYSAGHRKGSEGVSPGFLDRIPFDVVTSAVIAVFAVEIAVINEMYADALRYIVAAGLVVLDIAVAMAYILTLANRLKLGVLLKNNLIVIIGRWIFKAVRKLCSFVFRSVGKLPLVWKTLAALLIVSAAEFLVIMLSWYETDVLFFWWLAEKIVLSVLILYIAYCMKKLKTGGEEIANGNLGCRVDTQKMLWDFKEHGETLNNIGGGMSAAVDEKMKSERMKTELITNVSHDIKTPLTSIVNYVDLLKKEKIDNETASEYIDVLERQSARLKKLVEDLIEASKASTGNITVSLENCDVGVLLDQTVGEYKEKAEKVNLNLLLTKPEEPVIIKVDGRHMWRIFDNLMNNICKYTQEHTRVYLSLEKKEGKAIITFKNISKYPLNISSDELMERFVRGDSSRNTEGSGLGLSIARSLTELQGGKMELHVDGDLFKAVLSFDTI